MRVNEKSGITREIIDVLYKKILMTQILIYFEVCLKTI